jgi:tricorn protease
MEKVVEEVLKLTKENKHIMTPAPQPEDRSAKGLGKKK